MIGCKTIVMTMVIQANPMKTIMASEFKSNCLEIMDEVAASGEEVVVTKNGVPVGKFVPYTRKPKTLRGLHAGQVRASDDLIASLDKTWEAER
jgi:prevent-host-death family protein